MNNQGCAPEAQPCVFGGLSDGELGGLAVGGHYVEAGLNLDNGVAGHLRVASAIYSINGRMFGSADDDGSASGRNCDVVANAVNAGRGDNAAHWSRILAAVD